MLNGEGRYIPANSFMIAWAPSWGWGALLSFMSSQVSQCSAAICRRLAVGCCMTRCEVGMHCGDESAELQNSGIRTQDVLKVLTASADGYHTYYYTDSEPNSAKGKLMAMMGHDEHGILFGRHCCRLPESHCMRWGIHTQTGRQVGILLYLIVPYRISRSGAATNRRERQDF